MSVLPVGIGPVTGGYQIERSLRFNSADSAYLNRTPASAGNRKTWTWSGWVKRSGIGVINQGLFRCYNGTSDSTWTEIRLGVNNSSYYDSLAFGGYNTNWRITNAQYRDPSAWYHFVVVWDSSNATADNRVKIYVNGVQETSFFVSNNPAQNEESGINQASSHIIGHGNTAYLDGYLTEINFIDGQALTPSSFGQTNASTGVWEPIAYTGTYGTNGFYLKFADNSGTTSTTLGKDSSGNGNNWTPNNFSVTAGAGNDSLVDTPTSYGTDTGAGGEVRGNYCTLNPLQNGGITITNGNLTWAGAGSSAKCATGSIAMTSGKWYFEALITGSSGGNWYSGVCNLSPTLTSAPSSTATGWGLLTGSGGTVLYKSNNNVLTSLSSSSVTGAVVSFAVDVDAGKIWFAQNGTWLEGSPSAGTGASYTNLTGTQIPYVAGYDSNDQGSINFGQRPFAYTAPSGFKALCTQNLPTPTIGATSTTQANDYFNAVLYTGTGSSLGVTGVGFQPDWTWIKGRSGATDHGLYDAVRGVQKQLESNTTTAETTETTGLTAFNSDGFTVGALAQLNTNTATYVAWNWKANGAGSTNTAGTITSTVSANTTSGFSIVNWSGSTSTSAQTVGHGLGVTPKMVILKNRDLVDNWFVWFSGITSNSQNLYLNTTAALTTQASALWGAGMTSTLCGVRPNSFVNTTNDDVIMYVFAAVSGYSAFGSYTGNGSSDGTFVFTGFRPAFVMVKRTDSAGGWYIFDDVRSTYNLNATILQPNLSDAEWTGTNNSYDFLSNGFKNRGTGGDNNASGGTYIYAAFAESPFKYSLAR